MNVALRPDSLNLISLCAGGGGLDLGVELAIPSARPVVLVEGEAWSVATLVSAMEAGLMAPAPVWSDVRTFNGLPWRGLVDGLIGGIPCQPHSLAGKRLGEEDERDLWSPARRIIVQSRPWFVLIENVRGMLSAAEGLEPGAFRVWRDLQRIDYEVEFGVYTAEEVGASHERQRVFILAVANTVGQQFGARRAGCERAAGTGSHGQPAGSGEGLGDADGAGLERRLGGSDERAGERIARPDGCELVNAESLGRGERRTEPEFRSGRSTADGTGGPMADASRHAYGRSDITGEIQGAPSQAEREAQRQDRQRSRTGSGDGDEDVADASIARGGRISVQPRRQDQACADADRGDTVLVDAIGSGHNRVTESAERGSIGRTALERSGRDSFFPLFPPGPGEAGEWATIVAADPERLPALSRYDRFVIACRAAGIHPPRHQSGKGGRAPRVHSQIIQALAQRFLRRMADGLATEMDEARTEQLRMLGNGVVPLEAAYAIRALATRLARRSAGAAALVRLMNQ